MPLAIASRYASALADVISRPDSAVSPDAVLEQMQSFQGLLAESPDLLNALTSPAVRPNQKRDVVKSLADRLGLARPVRNFLYVVIDHRRLKLLGEMIEAFQSWLDSRLGIARIGVVSARPLEDPLKDSFRQRFGLLTGKQVHADFDVDPSLIGGAMVRHGSTIYDGSIRSQLRALDRSISGEA